MVWTSIKPSQGRPLEAWCFENERELKDHPCPYCKNKEMKTQCLTSLSYSPIYFRTRTKTQACLPQVQCSFYSPTDATGESETRFLMIPIHSVLAYSLKADLQQTAYTCVQASPLPEMNPRRLPGSPLQSHPTFHVSSFPEIFSVLASTLNRSSEQLVQGKGLGGGGGQGTERKVK